MNVHLPRGVPGPVEHPPGAADDVPGDSSRPVTVTPPSRVPASPPATPPSATPEASSRLRLRRALATPSALRQAILLREVLGPPVSRRPPGEGPLGHA